MRESELHVAVREEFGELGPVLLADLVLEQLDGRTGAEALRLGTPARAVWAALCAAQDVPVERRHGRGLRDVRP